MAGQCDTFHWRWWWWGGGGGIATLQPITIAPAVPEPSCGQLTVARLAAADRDFLEKLQSEANSHQYSGDLLLRNERCIAPDVRAGTFL